MSVNDSGENEDRLFQQYQQKLEAAKKAKFEFEAIEKATKAAGYNFGETHCAGGPKTTVSAAELAKRYLIALRAGEVKQLIRQHDALDGIEIGPGLLTILGAPPGFGKTALAMQIVFDGLELNPGLTATIANAETSFDGLLRRELSRRSRIKAEQIRFGVLDETELDEIEAIIDSIMPTLERISIVEECNLGSLISLVNQPPGMLVVDYLQKFSPPGAELRTGIGQVMASMRMLAKKDWAVLCLSATSRQQTVGKSEAKPMTMSSYRDSGEIEFNADSCYLLVDKGPIDPGCKYIVKTVLEHVKNRHGAKVDKSLEFHMPRMSFTAFEEEPQRHSEFDEYGGDF